MHANTVALLLLALSGCTGSRWARKDPTYAAKYNQHSDNVLQMAKQASDARFVEGRSGIRVGGEYGNSPGTVGGTIGIFAFPKSWFEVHGGWDGLIGTGDPDMFGGFGVGAKVHTPSRLSAFAGLGGQFVFNEKDLQFDNLDNDNDGLFDEPDEAKIHDFYAAVLPEVGIHFWLTAQHRVSASARYSISSSGRADDQWLFGLSFSRLKKERSEEFRTDYILSEFAKQNLDEIHADLVATHDPQFVARYIDRIYDDFESIAADPEKGVVVADDSMKFETNGGPIIEYRKSGKGIEIATVIPRR